MAKHEVLRLVDDLDGGEADQTVSFGLDGSTYEIDLSDGHAAALREALSSFVAAARRGNRAASPRARVADRAPSRSAQARNESKAIREWARANGFDVPDRGRIPGAVRDAYRDGSAAPSTSAAAAEPAADREPTDGEVLAWHEAKGYKIPASRAVNGLMRHRYRSAHQA